MNDRDLYNKLGSFLKKYTDKGGASFDAAFTQNIKTLAPHWFKG